MPRTTADSSASALLGLASSLLGLGVIAVTLRFFARFRQKAALRWDDWLVLPGLATLIGACACVIYSVHLKAFGYSTGDFSKEYVMATLESSAKAQIALNLSSLFCLACSKGSALFLYKRIFCSAGSNRVFNTIIIASLVVVACWLITFEFLLAFQCHTHFDAVWTGGQAKYCDLSYAALEGQAISDFLLDVWVLLLPIVPILRLKTSKSKKLAIASLFLLGCIGVGASIARMVIIIQLVNIGQAEVHKINPEHYISRIAFYVVMEMGISLIAVNLPSIWGLVTTAGPDALLRSIRSVISLATTASRSVEGSRDGSHLEGLKGASSTPSSRPETGTSTDAKVYKLNQNEVDTLFG